jgi:hypothetical protein
MLSRLNGGLISTPNKRVYLGLPNLSASVGQHIGHFYRTKEESKHVLVSFLRAGLLEGDRCVCHLSSYFTSHELHEALASSTIDIDQAIASGHLCLEESHVTYREMMLKYNEVMERAVETGSVFRWVGDVTHCVTMKQPGEQLSESERILSTVKNLSGVFLCQYDLTRLSASILMDAQIRHPIWVINNVIHNNPFYENGSTAARRHWFDERYQVLMEINNAISSVSDKSSLLTGIARVLEKVLKFDRADLALLDSSGQTLRIYDIVENLGMKGEVPIGTEFSLAESILQEQVIRENKPILIRDLRTEKKGAMGERILREGILSAVLVPLVRNEKALGTLNVGSRNPNCYSEKDAELLMEVARQLALPIENLLVREEIDRLKSRFEEESPLVYDSQRRDQKFQSIVGQSLAIRRVLKAVETVAPTDAGVLLSGETGTGKELIVHALHNLSTRKNKPLVKVNCAALPAGD